jgi:hypothetical protein
MIRQSSEQLGFADAPLWHAKPLRQVYKTRCGIDRYEYDVNLVVKIDQLRTLQPGYNGRAEPWHRQCHDRVGSQPRLLTELCSPYGYDETMNESKTGKPGPVHKTPTDLRMALRSETKTQAAGKDLMPLARNEWICWVTSSGR